MEVGRFILYAAYIVVELGAACLLFARRKQQPDRSRIFIAVFFFLSAMSAVIGSVSRIMHANLFVTGEVMGPASIILGFVTYFLLLLYPIEVMRPRWLNAGRAGRILAPWLFFFLCFLAMMPFDGVRSLHSLSETLRNIGYTDVYLRVVLSLIFIPYGIWLYRFQYNWKMSSASKLWIRSIVALAMLMTVTFSMHSIFGIGWMLYVHFALYFLLTFIILHYELRARFRVPEGCGDGEDPEAFREPAPESFAGTPSDAEASPDAGIAFSVNGVPDRVKEKLRFVIDDPLVWQNPEISVRKLCDLVGTNTNYLQKAIREMGWQSYSDMINRKRVEYVCESLSSGETENIQDAFYRAGYRSRVTAWRNFTAITGVSPLEWAGTEKSRRDRDGDS